MSSSPLANTRLGRFTSFILSRILCLLLFISFVQASPLPSEDNLPRAAAVSSTLRILPLGDSITWGYPSTDGNGYRKQLVANLNSTGNKVTMVGSNKHGLMWDPWNAGYPRNTIAQIQAKLPWSTGYRPNVILIHAGTNDMDKNILKQDGQAIDRLSDLVDVAHNACPDAVILVAQIIASANAAVQVRTDLYNRQIPGMVGRKLAAGYKILTVDMRSITSSQLVDGVHPTDQAYLTMGNIWAAGVATAQSQGLITAPVGADPKLDYSPGTV